MVTLFFRPAVRLNLRDNYTSKSQSRRPIGSSRPAARENRTRARPRVALQHSFPDPANEELRNGDIGSAAAEIVDAGLARVGNVEHMYKARPRAAEASPRHHLHCTCRALGTDFMTSPRRAKTAGPRREVPRQRFATQLSSWRPRWPPARAPKPLASSGSHCVSRTRSCREHAASTSTMRAHHARWPC